MAMNTPADGLGFYTGWEMWTRPAGHKGPARWCTIVDVDLTPGDDDPPKIQILIQWARKKDKDVLPTEALPPDRQCTIRKPHDPVASPETILTESGPQFFLF